MTLDIAAGISNKLGDDMKSAGVEVFKFSDLKVAEDRVFGVAGSLYSWEKEDFAWLADAGKILDERG